MDHWLDDLGAKRIMKVGILDDCSSASTSGGVCRYISVDRQKHSLHDVVYTVFSVGKIMSEVVGWVERVHSEGCFNLFPRKYRRNKCITTR